MLTDFHTHILPGIDDGAKNVEEALALLRQEKTQGVGRVVLTPHFYPRYETPDGFLRKREAAFAQLQAAAEQYGDLPKMVLGAEVYFFRGMSESESLNALTIGGGDCILIEMPPAPWPEEVLMELERIYFRRGLTPVVAHIDRYIGPWRTYGLPRRLAQMPVLVQANGEFFLERSTAALALRMLKAQQIQLLGSDCHNLTDRKPNLAQAARKIRKSLGDEALTRMGNYEWKLLDRWA